MVLAGPGPHGSLDAGSQQGNGGQENAGPSGTFWKLQAREALPLHAAGQLLRASALNCQGQV